jgi:hypothetical protein
MVAEMDIRYIISFLSNLAVPHPAGGEIAEGYHQPLVQDG